MEVCVLKFKGTDLADEALNRVASAQATPTTFLHEVAVVKRPLVGRISIRATFGDEEVGEIKQGDIAAQLKEAGAWTGYLVGSLGGPLHAQMSKLEAKRIVAPAAKELENDLMRIDDIKRLLPRGSSALVLVAAPDNVTRMVELFGTWKPEVIRREISREVEMRLEELDRLTQASAAAAE